MARRPTPAPSAEEDRATSKRIGALAALMPFMAPYRWLMAAAGAALVLTAMISLTLPLAVRRVIDNFGTGETELLDLYFVAAITIAGLLALGTGLRMGIAWRDMAVSNLRTGQPVIEVTGWAADRLKAMTPEGHEAIIHVTLTDDHPWAQAFVVIEARPKP